MPTPLLTIDVYHANFGDSIHGTSPRWSTLWNPQNRAAGFVGAYLKAGQGSNPHSWFGVEWPKVRAAAGERAGVDAFRGPYWWVEADQDGAHQADVCVDHLERHGGLHRDDMHLMIDCERGSNQQGGNYTAGAADWVRVASAFVARARARLGGRPIICYGRSIFGDLKIHSDFGCALGWDPSYTARQHLMPDPPWPRERVVMWQYTGDPKTNQTTFPDEAAGFGKTDVSVFLGRTKEEMYSLPIFRGLMTGDGPGVAGGVPGLAALALAGAVLLV